MSLRRVLIVIAVLAGSLVAPGQDGFIVHFNALQAGKNGTAVSVREVSQGYLVFCRQVSQDGTNEQHVFTRLLDSNGIIQGEFEYTFGDDRDYDIGYLDAVANDVDGSFVAAIAEGWGYTDTTFIYRFDVLGQRIERVPMYSYSAIDSVTHAIRQSRKTTDNGFVLGGFWQRSGDAQAHLVRLSIQLDTLWTKRIGSLAQNEVILGLAEYSDGGFVLTGYRSTAWDISFLMRTDANGNPLWTRYYGGSAGQNGAVRVTADGGIVTWSDYRDPSWPSEYSQVMLTKWNANGQVLWQRKSHYGFNSGARDFEVLPDGSFVGTAFISDASLNGVLCKFSPEGDSLWTRSYHVTNGPHYLNDITLTSDGGFVCTGEANRDMPQDAPNFQQSQTIYVVKTDSLGCVVPGCSTVGVQEYAVDLNEYLRIAPNPVAVGQPLSITFEPPAGFTAKGPLRVVVLDALGKEVQTLSLAGPAEQLTTDNLSPGLYYLHLIDGTRWLAGGKVVVE